MVRPEALCSSENVDSYGPATIAVTYEEMRGVGSNVHVAAASPERLAAIAEMEKATLILS